MNNELYLVMDDTDYLGEPKEIPPFDKDTQRELDEIADSVFAEFEELLKQPDVA